MRSTTPAAHYVTLITTGGGGIEDLRGWLTTVTGRICLDALRRRGCSAPRPEWVPADETQQPGLGIRIAGYLDPGAVLAGSADNLLHLLHPAEELSTEAGVEPQLAPVLPRSHESSG